MLAATLYFAPPCWFQKENKAKQDSPEACREWALSHQLYKTDVWVIAVETDTVDWVLHKNVQSFKLFDISTVRDYR